MTLIRLSCRQRSKSLFSKSSSLPPFSNRERNKLKTEESTWRLDKLLAKQRPSPSKLGAVNSNPKAYFQSIKVANSSQHMSKIGSSFSPYCLVVLIFAQGSESLSSKSFSFPPLSNRERNKLNTDESKPGSVNSSRKAYFQSIRAATASTAPLSDKLAQGRKAQIVV